MAKRLAVVPPAAPSPLELLVSDYLASCLARGTIEQYRFSLHEVFLPWCRGQGITTAAELTQRVLDRYMSTLLESGGRRGELSRNTSHTYIRHDRQLLGWAHREGETSAAAKPHLPRLPRRVLDVLSREEIEQLEAAATAERDKLLIRLLADTGIRVGELCGLRVDDVVRHERGSFLKVRGKGQRSGWSRFARSWRGDLSGSSGTGRPTPTATASSWPCAGAAAASTSR